MRRNYCFTLNNPTFDESAFLIRLAHSDMAREENHVRYIVFQSEIAPETNTPHFQGYVEFLRAKRISSASRYISGSNRCHLEFRMGTQEQAIAYCKKDDTREPETTPYEGGQRSRAKPDKLGEVVEQLVRGATPDQIAEDHPQCYLLHKEKILDRFLELKGGRDRPPEIEILYGETGTGKSYSARTLNPGYYLAPWPTGGRWWWPNYKGESCVILDEFRHQIKFDTILSLFDRYEFNLESKGRSFSLQNCKIVITTNIDPKDWYPKVPSLHKDPLARRINEFATIWDYESGHTHPNFVRTQRTGEFTFNETVVDDYVTNTNRY